MARGRKRAISTTSTDSTSSSSNEKSSNRANIITHIVLPPRRMITRSLLNGTSPALSELAESLHLESTLHTINKNDKASSKNSKHGPTQTANTLSLSASLNPSSTLTAAPKTKAQIKSINAEYDEHREQNTDNENNHNSSNIKGKYEITHEGEELQGQHMSSSSSAFTNPSSSYLSSPMSPRVLLLGGVLRCVCNAFLITPQETLLECCKCRNWCHPACVRVDHAELRHLQRTKTFVCPYCTGEESTNFHPAVMMLNISEKGASLSTSSSYSVTPTINTNGLITSSIANGNKFNNWQLHETKNVKGKNQTAKRTREEQLSQDESQFKEKEEQEEEEYQKEHMKGNNIRSSSTSTSTSSSITYTLGRHPPAPRQIPLRLREIPDHLPETGAAYLSELLQRLHGVAHAMNYDVIDLPMITQTCSLNNNNNMCSASSPSCNVTTNHMNSIMSELTDKDVAQCVECCEVAIRDATFSETYPAYCLKEIRSHLHPYVQGTLLRCRKERKIRAMILSNGMDVYGNLKPTITQLKSAINRKSVDQACLTQAMQACLDIVDVSDFVHVTLSATHIKHQRRGLAKLLMSMELLKWALRGRTRAFLNMAIEKKLVEVVQTDNSDNTDSVHNNIISNISNNKRKGYANGKNSKSGGMKVEYSSPPASRRLYHLFNFEDVYPRYDPLTQSEKWTAKEADMGRVMVNLEFVSSAIRVAERIIHEHNFPEQQQEQHEQHKEQKEQQQTYQVEPNKTKNSVLSLKYNHNDCKTEFNDAISGENICSLESISKEEKEKKEEEECVTNVSEHNKHTNDQDGTKYVATPNWESKSNIAHDIKQKEVIRPTTEKAKLSAITQLVNGRDSLSLYKRRRSEAIDYVNANTGTRLTNNTFTSDNNNNNNNNSETVKKMNSVKSTRISKTITPAETLSSLEGAAAPPLIRRTNHSHDIKTSAYNSTTRFSRPFSLTRMKNTKQLLVQQQEHQQQKEQQEEEERHHKIEFYPEVQ